MNFKSMLPLYSARPLRLNFYNVIKYMRPNVGVNCLSRMFVGRHNSYVGIVGTMLKYMLLGRFDT